VARTPDAQSSRSLSEKRSSRIGAVGVKRLVTSRMRRVVSLRSRASTGAGTLFGASCSTSVSRG